jgi:predicted MFS family arabinose efflux permease
LAQSPPTRSTTQETGATTLPAAELIALTLARVALNTAHRMVYPFLPAISRGLGVTPAAMRILVSARSAVGFTSPLFGPISDRFGRRAMMLLALAMFTLAMFLIPIWPVYSVVFVAFVLVGLAKVIYDPSLQAYIGDRVAYTRRGLAMGTAEMSWSLSILIGAPLVGLSIQRFGWTSPFIGLAALAFLGLLAILQFVRHDAGASATVQGNGFARSWNLLSKRPAALGALGFALLISMANEIMFVVYGEWMEGSFGLQVGTLGLLTAVIGIAELGGELVVVLGSDRLGKRRVVVAGLVVSALAYGWLPWLGVNLEVALVLLFVMFISFETAIVGSVPLVSELLPAARGTMMATYLMAFSIGRTVGALLGGWLMEIGGFALDGIVAGVLNIAAMFLVLAVIDEAPIPRSEVPGADH